MTGKAVVKHLTVAEFMAQYHDQLAEVVDGEVIIMPPPTRHHVRLAIALYNSLNDYLAENPLGTAWPDNTPYVLDCDPRTDWVRDSRVPDVSFITQNRMEAHDAEFGEDDNPWRLAPDLAVEFVSPHDRYSDVNDKVEDYLKYGTRLVWIIDPQTRVIRVYTPDDTGGSVLHDGDTLTGDPVLPGWSLAVKTVLDGKG